MTHTHTHTHTHTPIKGLLFFSKLNFYEYYTSFLIMIIMTAAYNNPNTKLQENHAFTGPCDECVIQWLDPCCVSFKCPALTNYSVGVDGYGASGYCHGVIYPVIGPGGFTTVCSPKPGVVQLYLWQNERCGSYTYNNMLEPPLCEDPMPCN